MTADQTGPDDTRDALAWAIHRACGCDGTCLPDREDYATADAVLAAGFTRHPDTGLRERVEASPFVAISAVLDAQRVEGVSDGEHLWRRVTKVCEESGEVWRALSGYVAENPRKGQTHTLDDLRGELLDTASAALCGWAHLADNDGDPIPALLAHVEATATRLRAALAEPTPGAES